jgi:hypothetical protein
MINNDLSSKNDRSLTDRVRQFAEIIDRLVTAAKQPGFSKADYAPLSELAAIEEFERVGIWREVMNWQEYIEFLGQFANAKGFETTVRRVTEVSNLVFYEIEERHFREGKVNVVDSMNVYEFNEADKIRRMYIYVQGIVEPSIPFEAMRFRG